MTSAPAATSVPLLTVHVYHNIHEDAVREHVPTSDGYREGDALVHVADIKVPIGPTSQMPNVALEEVYDILNIGDDPTFGPVNPQAVEYRRRGNRSLSIGDVLVIDGVAFAVDRQACKRVTVPAESVRNDVDVPGSTGKATTL